MIRTKSIDPPKPAKPKEAPKVKAAPKAKPKAKTAAAPPAAAPTKEKKPVPAALVASMEKRTAQLAEEGTPGYVHRLDAAKRASVTPQLIDYWVEKFPLLMKHYSGGRVWVKASVLDAIIQARDILKGDAEALKSAVARLEAAGK